MREGTTELAETKRPVGPVALEIYLGAIRASFAMATSHLVPCPLSIYFFYINTLNINYLDLLDHEDTLLYESRGEGLACELDLSAFALHFFSL